MADTKYGYLVKQLKYERVSGGGPGGRPEYMTMPRGVDLEGLNISFAHGFRSQLGEWGSDGGVKHAHPYNETLLFAGLDYDNPNTLGAEIDVSIGEEGETYTVNSPTVIALPAGTPHGPLVTRKADKPFGFLAVSCD
ncbi:MAG: hypothetical protein MUO19_01170, partial [Dehalococcoidales bacterium]|nr:hypothetical protein [Dehalococcoidales bacterium]